MARSGKAQWETTCPSCGQVFDVGERDSIVTCPSCAHPIRLVDEVNPGPAPKARPLLAWLLGTLTPAVVLGGSVLVAFLNLGWFSLVVIAVFALVAIGAAVWNGFGADGWRLTFGAVLLAILAIFLVNSPGGGFSLLDSTVLSQAEQILLGTTALVEIFALAVLATAKRKERGVWVQRVGVSVVAGFAIVLGLGFALITLLFGF